MGTPQRLCFQAKEIYACFSKSYRETDDLHRRIPYEDDEPMPATEFHAEQVRNLADQLIRYFAIHPHIHIGVDTFIYYREAI